MREAHEVESRAQPGGRRERDRVSAGAERADLARADAAAGSTVRQVLTITDGLSADKAREVARAIKDAKLKKVQAAIQGDTVRISSPSKDDLQGAIALLKQQDFGVELKFENFRSN